MDYTESQYDIVDIDAEEAADKEYKIRLIVDDILTAALNGEDYQGYNFKDVLDYLDADEDFDAWHQFTLESAAESVTPDTRKDFMNALKHGAEAIAEKIYGELK